MSDTTASDTLLVRHADLVTDGQIHRGLKGVLVDTTTVCEIDDADSRLRYRGYDVTELCQRATFEDVIHLLLWGELPTSHELAQTRSRLDDGRRVPAGVVDVLRRLPRSTPPMTLLRTAVSALGCFEGSRDLGLESLRLAALRLSAQVPTLLAAIGAHRRGLDLTGPVASASHAEHLLRSLCDRSPTPDEVSAIDRVLTIHADHEFNASCFSARVTISTLSDLHAAITAAIGTLSGSLHGGANERVLEMIATLDRPDQVEAFVEERLRGKEKIPGFGQRGCRYEDPRALLLRDLAARLARSRGTEARFELFLTLNEVMRRRTTLWPNVDFYSASVLDSLGIATDFFTPVFVASRIVGWCAHIIEQVERNVLIRPKGLYAGPVPRSVPTSRL